MDLKISANTSIENIVQKNNYQWNLSWKKSINAFVILLGIAAVFILYDIFDRAFTFFGINIFLSIGAAFIIYAILVIIFFYSRKKDASRELDRYIQLRRDFRYEYELTEERFIYSDSEVRYEIAWRQLSGYYDTKNYVYLLIDGQLTSLMLIVKSELSESDLNSLIMILQKKLPRAFFREVRL